MKIATIESFTGGLMAAKLTSIPGASRFFKGGLVTYYNEIKAKLGVDISKGVINKEVALSMSQKGKEYFDVDLCLSFTGNAGPTSMENKPVGLVYIGIGEEVFELFLFGTREEIRNQAVEFAFEKIEKFLP